MARERTLTFLTRVKPGHSYHEMLEVDLPGGKATAVFTTERRAQAYYLAAGFTREDGWAMFTLPRHMAEDDLRHEAALDSGHVVIDLLPDGKRGRRLTVFEALVELD
jgi:hypothetical protein